jgi:hypothetical protein
MEEREHRKMNAFVPSRITTTIKLHSGANFTAQEAGLFGGIA